MVLVLCSHDEREYSELGFDTYELDNWDGETRADIAQHMAIADIAEKIHQCQMID
jgi:hypothetical protein